MDNQFRKFLDTFLDAWRSSSLTEISDLISNNYKGREITGGEIVDFEFDESILGWEQGFKFVKENNAQWELNEISIIPLRADEMLVIISATILMQGEGLNTANLFFQTFKKDSSKDWKLIRSYIEAGIPIENIKRMQFN
ncbi:flavoprotein [Neobacillus sp. 114]|uniref:flavoprotein n=1 Tax=Neobacillus sp. 114 TaxID=3048535 RepID=UPI001C236822|nr:flavoprotein [Neobacillus sp. 114]MBU8915960.1 flavoprotein [Bacillus sp. FJAT-29953]